MRPSRIKGYLISAVFLVAAAGGLSGCGQTRMLHTDGHVFRPLFVTAIPDAGWLAVDSCSTGIHALAEIEVVIKERSNDETHILRADNGPFILIYSGDPVTGKTFSHADGPVCYPRGISDWKYGDGSASFSDDGYCTYLYRVEFELSRVPVDSTPILIRYDNQPPMIARR